MKIHIFYRHTSNNVVGLDRPSWFNYEKCFQNTLHTIQGNNNVTLTVAMDGDSSLDFISKYKESFEMFQTNHNSSLLSYRDLLKYIKQKNMQPNDLIYFLENDYLHVEGWVEKVMELLKTYDGLDYVSYTITTISIFYLCMIL
jgi:hypothetical protein